MTYEEQIQLAPFRIGMSHSESTKAMNSVVVPCPSVERPWWKLWRFWIPQHKFEDITYSLNTVGFYMTADRCKQCGLIVTGSGL